MPITAKELRYNFSRVLNKLRRGQEITLTYRGKPIAVIKPIAREEKPFKSIAYGIWKDRDDLKDVEGWITQVRQTPHRV